MDTLTVKLLPYAAPFPGIESLWEAVGILTFTVHLILINILVGCLCIVFLNSFSFNKLQKQQAPQLATQKTILEGMEYLPKTLALAVNFGVPPLLFVQLVYGQFTYPAAIIQGFWWLGIMLLVMIAYYGLYLFNSQESLLRRQVILIISISFLFLTLLIQSSNAVISQDPNSWLNWLAIGKSTLFLTEIKHLIPRTLHTIISSLAIGGLALATYSELRKRQGIANQEALINNGLNWFKHATLLQFIIGTWYFLSLTETQQTLLLASPLMHILFTLILILTFASLYFAQKKQAIKTVFCTILTIGLMVSIRAFLKRMTILSFESIRPEVVSPQFSILLTFLVSLLFTAIIVYFVLKIAYKTNQQA
ncbi:hypothetical protein [Desulfovibrio litoralis]|uniref:Uncharacterized protein n=1 Tax=Desulfovibrio litoralis DSM 11393 TaxID=1121455 RepID=A0A1M7S155_9BACT|nr:hypothetical protein [Desulfovibrio litoralis]SHN52349.1 hypothetical protein SAMN02745728_00453 [Desulfovibrio litoralis DSM 11393]